MVAMRAVDRLPVTTFSGAKAGGRSSSASSSSSGGGAGGGAGAGSAGGGGSSEEKKCIICLEAFTDGDKIRTLPCLHDFHVTCIDEWLLTKAECPLDEQKI